MEKLIEVMTNMGMEQFAENTRQELVLSDQVILKDLEDEKNLEQRYEEMDIPREQKMFVNVAAVTGRILMRDWGVTISRS